MASVSLNFRQLPALATILGKRDVSVSESHKIKGGSIDCACNLRENDVGRAEYMHHPRKPAKRVVGSSNFPVKGHKLHYMKHIRE